MEKALNSTISHIEVAVENITEASADLKIIGTDKMISWPINSLPFDIKAGDHLILELKLGQTTTLKEIIEKAQIQEKKEGKNISSMHKLLEDLIN